MKIGIKKLIISVLTLTVLIISNLLLSKYLKVQFLELSFLTGLMFTILTGFLSSEGGATSEMLDVGFKRFLEKSARTSSHFIKFHITIPFIIALIYTILAGIISVAVYWKYFF
ncbi:MAG: hypothetical protein ACRC3Y_03905 [Romboutsia sp.]|uniref:hypothetical protein n=1 Tax=Romboutsia sp. TaxID=1965302 RepID=UPI003F3A0B0E